MPPPRFGAAGVLFVGLTRLILHEPVSPRQRTGLGLAAIAVAAIAVN